MRLIAAAALMLGVCWISVWPTASAQEPSGSPGTSAPMQAHWVFVTGSEESCSDTGWETTTASGLYRGRMEFTCTTRLSDPRVSGPASGEYHFACGGPAACLYWGDYEIVGPDGTWVGSWSGLEDPAGGASFNVTTEGTGDYAGWTFMAVLRDPLDGTPATVHGLIFEGTAPPQDPFPSAE
jgi:hypothetical protein